MNQPSTRPTGGARRGARRHPAGAPQPPSWSPSQLAHQLTTQFTDRRRALTRVGLLAVVAVVGVLLAPQMVPARAATAPVTVSLTFDDGWANQLLALPALQRNNMKATFYVNSNRLGRGSYMSLQDVYRVRDAGHEVAGHTSDHVDLRSIPDDDQKRQICEDRDRLLGWGFQVRSFAYPYGSSGPNTPTWVRNCGYNSARGVGGLRSGSACVGCPYAEVTPPRDLYYMATPDSIHSYTTLDQMKAYVTQAESNGGGWVPLVFHHVCDGCNVYSVRQDVLEDFLAWLAARAGSGTQVRTVGDVIGGPVRPPASAPPVPEVDRVRNASLETDANNDRVPDCWQLGGFGTNTFTWTRTSDAHTGSWAEKVDITARTNGDRKLVVKQDTSTCAPGVDAGSTHRLTGWYKSTAPVQFVTYYRTAADTWVYWATSPEFPASSGWRQATWTTPAVPAGGTAISFGLTLATTGSLTTDDYDLDPAP